jgi:dTDP-4-dehydrorhamnose reductase
VAADQEGSPTGVEDLAAGILELVRVEAAGIVHLTCSGEAGRAEFAEAVLELGGHPETGIVPVESARLQLPARRPRDSRLDINRFSELTGTVPRHWRDALRAVLAASREEG